MDKISLKNRIGLELFRLKVNNDIKLHELNTLFWEATLRCNLSCKHCGSDCRKESLVNDMPKEDFYRVIDELYDHVNPNKTLIIMTGGEILMRKDIEEIGLHLYKKGFPWGLVTNGMALDSQRFESLLRSGLRSITVSLDGFAEEHNEMRGNKNSFDRAVEAIKLISKEPSVAWDIVTCVTPKNLEYLEEFKKFLTSIGVAGWRIFTVVPMGRAKDDASLQLTNQQFKGLMDFIVETKKEGSININYACEGFLGQYENKVRSGFYNCRAGVSVASILVDGSISGCTSIRSKYYQGNIYKDNFWDVWDNRFEQYRNREWMKKGECKDCKVFAFCRGNGMHLRTEDGELMLCHYNRLK